MSNPLPLPEHTLAAGTTEKPRLSRRLYRVIGVVGGGILLVLLLLALFPHMVAPYDPTERVGRPLQKPGDEFWLGTNDIGQDLFS